MTEGRAEIIEIPFSTRQYSELRELCQRQELTLSNLVQAAWALVLQSYTGASDICFGYLSSGRSMPVDGIDRIVGPLINLLVCRIANLTDLTLRDLLLKIRQEFADALAFQAVSLPQVQRVLGNSEVRLFNTIVTCQYSYSPAAATLSEGRRVLRQLATHNATEFDVVIKVMYSDTDMNVRLCYSTVALTPDMAHRVAQTLTSVITGFLPCDLDQSVTDFTVLSTHDRLQVEEWNRQTQAIASSMSPSAIRPNCIHQLIEETATREPKAPALSSLDGEMDYETLVRLATMLAHRIVESGVGPRAFVPLCFEKSVWYSVSLLAVMKSGNAFCPLDVSNPVVRLQQMLHELDVSPSSGVIVCSRDQAAKCAPLCKQIIVVDSTLLLSSAGHIPRLLPEASPEDAACSTGEPKGVVIQHKSYTFAAQAHQSRLHVDNQSQVLQFASYGFDTSMEDHLTTLMVGGCICTPSEHERLNDLARFATRANTNWAHLTPSVANILNATQTPIRTMVLGGEPMTAQNVRMWAGPGRRLVQVYGPSECCVTSTVNSNVAADTDTCTTDIERVLPGCAAWVVRPDNHHALCPIGAVGELLVQGPILAREYLKAPDQTGAAFVSGVKWAADPGCRLYKTGDLVRYDSHGHLHFVDRKDAQVKIRGQRIEPGEIEKRIVLHHGVLHSMVVVPKAGPWMGQLVSIVSRQGHIHKQKRAQQKSPKNSLSVSATQDPIQPPLVQDSVVVSGFVTELRRFRFDKLPPYMLPELWVVSKDIPQNSSGKLDRKLMVKYLEDMDDEQSDALIRLMEGCDGTQDATYIRSGSQVEETLRAVWSIVLNVPETEIAWNSSLFALGGDLIAAMAISSAARARGIYVATADILRHRTIERLASIIPPQEHDSTSPTTTATTVMDTPTSSISTTVRDSYLPHEDTTIPWPLSPIQQLHFQAMPDGDNLDQQTMVLSLTRPIPPDMICAAFEAVVTAHPMLQARFIPPGISSATLSSEWMQYIPDRVDSFDNLSIRFHDDVADSACEKALDIIDNSKCLINITDGPLIAVDVFCQDESNMIISVTVHHLVIDAVSWRIVLQDLEDFLFKGKPIRPEPLLFADWCRAAVECYSTASAAATTTYPRPDVSSTGDKVEHMTSSPDSTIAEVNLISDHDRQLISKWNQVRPQLEERLIHDLIRDTTLRQPDRPAIYAWDGEMTYRQLDVASSKISSKLVLSHGVQPEEIVVLCFEKSMWATVAMLAVVKSWAAFVHVDPNAPESRVKAIVSQTKSRIGLASSTNRVKLQGVVDQVLVVNQTTIDNEVPTRLTPPQVQVQPSNALYVIFTSGSTGTPKA